MSPVTRDTSGDVMADVMASMDPRRAFHRRVPREKCPYPPGNSRREAWLAGWDDELAKALQDLNAARVDVSRRRADREAMEEAANCLLACTKTIKATGFRQRCERARAALEARLEHSGSGVAA